MAKLKQFDKPALKALRQEINAALESVAKKNGITLRLGNISYSSDTFRGKLEATIVTKDASGATLSKEQLDFQKNAKLLGFKPEDLGRKLKDGTVIHGANLRAHKYPLLVRTERGAIYKETIERVKSLM